MIFARLAALVAMVFLMGRAANAGELPYAFDRTYGELPKSVVPVSYAIALTPHLDTMRFDGRETVVVNVRRPTPAVALNADGLTIDAATFDGATVPTTADAARQQITLTLPHAAAVGHHVMVIAYHGPIGSDGEGLFALPYRGADGAQATMLSTFFESTNARRMFPCWDEPAFRASFAVTIAIPAVWTAIGNMPVASRVEHGDVATVTFAPTPLMATYLVHVTAGDYRALHSLGAGIPQAIWAPAGTERDGAYALAGVQRVLPFYQAYFAQRYPLPKLDHIAIPGGFGGAMENWGAIAYQADNLLVPPAATVGARENAFHDFTHEMAHQWFGDLVTMAWWDDLWLNESFADWLSIKTTDALNPAWHYRETTHLEKEMALDVDARLLSNPIRRPVVRGGDIMSQFDPPIQYVKGRSVIGMLESYVGANAFRTGLRTYMAAHRFSNTTGADLWSALDRASGKPVDAVARTWIEQPGFPLIAVATRCDAHGARTARFTQQRFLMIGHETHPERWNVPIVYASSDGATRRLLLRGDAMTVAAGRCGEALRANAGDLGFYRVAYDAPTRAANLRAFATLPATDKLTMIGDAWALARAGRGSPLDVFALANAMGRDTRASVWLQIAAVVQMIDGYERGKPGRPAFRAAALRLIAPLVTQLGWDASPSETEPAIEQLRERLIALAGSFGDAATLAEAQRRFAGERAGTLHLTADQEQTVYTIVGRNADAAAFAQLQALAGGSDRRIARSAIAAMVLAGDPALRSRALDFVVSSAVPAEDAALRVRWIFAAADVDTAMAWSVFSANEDALFAPLDELTRSFSAQAAIGAFGDAVPLETIQANVAARVPGAAGPIAAAVQAARDGQTIAARILPAIDGYASQGAAGSHAP